MSFLQPPLVRTHATDPSRKDIGIEGNALLQQVLRAYESLPFRGPDLILPGNVVVCEDLWHSSLRDKLEILAEDGLASLKEFNLETWLTAKVEQEGSQDQKDELRELRRSLDEAEAEASRINLSYEIVSEYGGLPTDIGTVMHEPFTEIPVYRSLDFPVQSIDDSAGQSADDSTVHSNDDSIERLERTTREVSEKPDDSTSPHQRSVSN